MERSEGLREFGPKALTLATELPEVGEVFIDFALSTTGPRMILRLRCVGRSVGRSGRSAALLDPVDADAGPPF